MDWDLAIDRNGEALKRILVALAAIAGLLDAAGFCLPRDIYCAVAHPLRAAEAAARLLSADPVQGSPGVPDLLAVANLKRCFAALRRALDKLVRGLRQPTPDPIWAFSRAVRGLPAGPQAPARRRMQRWDTS